MPGRFSIPLLTAALLLLPAVTSADELTGRQIVDEVADRHEVPFEFENQDMTLIDKAGNKEEREMRRFARRGKKDLFKYLVVFRTPAGVKGVALLTWQGEDGDDDQWLYLPSMGKKMKRIAKGGRKNYFMGTDYTFEDLVSDSRDNFVYEREADQNIDGKPHHVVKTTPKNKKMAKGSAYKFRRMFVRQDIMFIVKTEYYDKRSRLIKTQTNMELAQVEGKLWRASFTRVDNKKEKHVTEVRIAERKLTEKDVPKAVFKKRYVTSGKHVR